MILVYLHAILGLFQNARSMVEKRSSPFKALVIAPLPERKECIEKSAFSPAARARLFRACINPAADMGASPLMGAPSSATREMLENNYPRVIFQSMADLTVISCLTAITGHVAKHSWLYATEVRWSASSLMVLPHWKLKRNSLKSGA